jgi:protein ImuA
LQEQIKNIPSSQISGIMSTPASQSIVDELRQRISRLAGASTHGRSVLPFGIEVIDRVLPGGGLPLGALHEVAGGGNGAIDGAAALFTAGVAARITGKVLWCLTRQDLFAPALAQAGLLPGRVIYVEAGDDRTLLACFEEGLRHGRLGAVVAEVARLSMTASRRLQLAAETSGALGIAVRRWRRQTEAADFGQPTASVTRWRVTTLPSTPLPVSGVGRARWQLELIRCRAEYRFRSGGLRCQGSSRSSFQPGRQTGSDGHWAPARLHLTRPLSWSAVTGDGGW